MELFSEYRGVIYRTCFTVFIIVTLLWCSVFLYGITYYLYIPAVAHVKPIYFQYDPACSDCVECSNKYPRHCLFPSANVSLVDGSGSDLLSRGQIYTVEISLEMPESKKNQEQGMFMITVDMMTQHGEILKTSARPAILHYKSSLFSTISTLISTPGLLTGTREEKQSLIIPLFEDYLENHYKPTHYVRVEVQSKNIEIYSATLRIHAQFTGLRYFMYYWPVLSAMVGISNNFFILAVAVLFTYLRHSTTSSEAHVASEEPDNQRPSSSEPQPQVTTDRSSESDNGEEAAEIAELGAMASVSDTVSSTFSGEEALRTYTGSKFGEKFTLCQLDEASAQGPPSPLLRKRNA